MEDKKEAAKDRKAREAAEALLKFINENKPDATTKPDNNKVPDKSV